MFVQPGALLYTGVGAVIGVAAALMMPPPDMRPLSQSPLFSPSALVSAAITPAAPAIQIPDIVIAGTPPEPAVHKVTLKSGDTLTEVLVKLGLERATAFNLIEAMRGIYNPRQLQAGQELQIAYDQTADLSAGATALAELSFEINPAHRVSVQRTEDGAFTAKNVIMETRAEPVRFEGTIDSTLFEAAEKQGVPLDVLTEMIKMFSYDVDFQRDIQSGDSFALLYDRTVTEDGRPVRNGGIRYATMNLGKTPLKYYAYEHEDGIVDYYNEKGEGVRKALLRTPLNGAKLTSNFGLRKHPILGYSTMHRGSDFGAATGTPVFAAGDGVIEKREAYGAYGNYVRIRHGSGYWTAYAHLSKFGDIGVGKRVRQGQVIGYVGSTGRSTGPHLHFEVLQNMKQVNPLKVKFPSSQKLEGATLTKFMDARKHTDQEFARLGTTGSVAMLNGAAGATQSE